MLLSLLLKLLVRGGAFTCSNLRYYSTQMSVASLQPLILIRPSYIRSSNNKTESANVAGGGTRDEKFHNAYRVPPRVKIHTVQSIISSETQLVVPPPPYLKLNCITSSQSIWEPRSSLLLSLPGPRNKAIPSSDSIAHYDVLLAHYSYWRAIQLLE